MNDPKDCPHEDVYIDLHSAEARLMCRDCGRPLRRKS